jgi:di/tricarboxylate transporter
MLAGMVIAPFMPSALGKMAIMSVIGIGVCDVLQLQPKSKAASAVMLTCFFAVSCPALSYATGGLHVAIAVGFLGKITSGGLGWLEYAYHNWILGMVFSIASLLLVIFLLKPECPVEEAGNIRTRYEQLGSVSTPEKRTLAILALIMMGFVTDRIHGVDPAWIMIMATMSFFLPGIRLMDGDKLGRLAYPLLFFITGAMSIGATASILGVSRWIAESLVPVLSDSSFFAVLVAYGFGLVSSFFIQSVALAGLFTPPLIDAALQLGVGPHAIVYSFLRGTDQAIFPYQFAVLAYVCSYGYIRYRHVVLVMSIRLVVDTCLFIGVAYPYWKWIGMV